MFSRGVILSCYYFSSNFLNYCLYFLRTCAQAKFWRKKSNMFLFISLYAISIREFTRSLYCFYTRKGPLWSMPISNPPALSNISQRSNLTIGVLLLLTFLYENSRERPHLLTALVLWPLWRGGKKNASTGGARRVSTNRAKTLRIEAKYSTNRGLQAWPLFLSLSQKSGIDKFARKLAKFSS